MSIGAITMQVGNVSGVLSATAALLALTLTACASTPSESPRVRDTSQQPLQQERAWVARAGQAKLGERIELPVDSPIPEPAVQVIGEYRAASGRHCRRLSSVEGSSVERVICRRTNGTWYLARRMSQGLHRLTPADTAFGTAPARVDHSFALQP